MSSFARVRSVVFVAVDFGKRWFGSWKSVYCRGLKNGCLGCVRVVDVVFTVALVAIG